MSEVCHDVSKDQAFPPAFKWRVTFSLYLQLGWWYLLRNESFWFGVVGSNPLFSKFNPCNAPLNRFNPFCQHECVKCRAYEEQVHKLEDASFSPLVFSTSGGMGASTTVTYKCLAFLLCLKWKTPYFRVMSWLRCRLGFSLLHSAVMCIRGSSCSSGHPLVALFQLLI